jgi:hypothetical protein
MRWGQSAILKGLYKCTITYIGKNCVWSGGCGEGMSSLECNPACYGTSEHPRPHSPLLRPATISALAKTFRI